MVSSASRRVSSWPVAIGKVRQSTMMSHWRMPQLPVRSSIRRLATAAFHSAVLALLVDRERDHRRSVLADDRHDPGDPRIGPVAILVVHRVDNGAAAEAFQP